MYISWQFLSQLRSSVYHIPNSFISVNLSNVLSFMESLVVKSVWDLENIIKFDLSSFNFMRLSFVHEDISLRFFCMLKVLGGSYSCSVPISDGTWSDISYCDKISERQISSVTERSSKYLNLSSSCISAAQLSVATMYSFCANKVPWGPPLSGSMDGFFLI